MKQLEMKIRTIRKASKKVSMNIVTDEFHHQEVDVKIKS